MFRSREINKRIPFFINIYRNRTANRSIIRSKSPLKPITKICDKSTIYTTNITISSTLIFLLLLSNPLRCIIVIAMHVLGS